MEMKRKINKILCIFVFVVMLSGVCSVYTPVESSAVPAEASGFYVDGTKIRDANGNVFVMRGVNHAYAWYKSNTAAGLKASANLKSNTARIVLSNGQRWTKNTASEVETLIKQCIQYKMIPMLEVHDTTGVANTASIDKAVEYWIELKNLLKTYEKYVMLNIGNEWLGSWNGKLWSTTYQAAIPTLRDAGIHNMIVVDAPGWGQDGPDCGKYCKSIFDADPDGNTIFSIHMYGTAGKDQDTIKSNIDGVLEKGVPVIIGEFGYEHTDGDVDEEYIMQYCEEMGVGYLGWSWKGNSSDVAYLDLAKSWNGSTLTAWGGILFNSTNGIKNTAKVCSVFNTTALSGNISKQTKQNDMTTVRFVAEVNIADVQKSTSGQCVVNSYDSKMAFENVAAYRKIWVNGVQQSAPSGKCYLVSTQFDGVSSGDVFTVMFSMDAFGAPISKTFTI